MRQPRGTILIVATMPKTGFSGGRYHTLLLAKCLAREGHRVKILTDNLPQMWGELEAIPDFGNVEFSVSPTFDFRSIGEAKIDHVLCIQNLGWARDFLASLESKVKFRASMTLLNFESPNWFNSLSEFRIPRYLWWPFWIVSLGSDRIISSTHEGTQFAKEYFWLASKKSFRTIPAPINSYALRQALKSSSTRPHSQTNIFIPTRIRGGDHKGIHEFHKILRLVQPGTRVTILSDDPKNLVLEKLTAELFARGIEVKLLTDISEVEKFETYLDSDITLFPSKFEGFGYPPVESIASGTPVVAYGLNVFKETLGDLVASVDSLSPDGFSRAVVEALKKKKQRIRALDAKAVAVRYSLEVVASQLSSHFESITFVKRSSLLACRFSIVIIGLLYRIRSFLGEFRKWLLEFVQPNQSS